MQSSSSFNVIFFRKKNSWHSKSLDLVKNYPIVWSENGKFLVYKEVFNKKISDLLRFHAYIRISFLDTTLRINFISSHVPTILRNIFQFSFFVLIFFSFRCNFPIRNKRFAIHGMSRRKGKDKFVSIKSQFTLIDLYRIRAQAYRMR